jgi:hypothetical protein
MSPNLAVIPPNREQEDSRLREIGVRRELARHQPFAEFTSKAGGQFADK